MKPVLIEDLKKLLIDNCMLKITADEIKEDQPLFGPEGLGLDSIDALQLTVAVEKIYGIPINDPSTAREALRTLNTLQAWLKNQDKEPSA
ncbi:MAG: phosphopantetheine-binding protein [bacterium]